MFVDTLFHDMSSMWQNPARRISPQERHQTKKDRAYVQIGSECYVEAKLSGFSSSELAPEKAISCHPVTGGQHRVDKLSMAMSV